MRITWSSRRHCKSPKLPFRSFEVHLGIDTGARTYRRHFDRAEKAYVKALTVIERNELRGNLETSESIHKNYYRVVLAALSPEKYPYERTETTDYEFTTLVEKDLETSSYIALAKIELMQGNKQNAADAFSRSVLICPIFAEHPVLGIALRTEESP